MLLAEIAELHYLIQRDFDCDPREVEKARAWYTEREIPPEAPASAPYEVGGYRWYRSASGFVMEWAGGKKGYQVGDEIIPTVKYLECADPACHSPVQRGIPFCPAHL